MIKATEKYWDSADSYKMGNYKWVYQVEYKVKDEVSQLAAIRHDIQVSWWPYLGEKKLGEMSFCPKSQNGWHVLTGSPESWPVHPRDQFCVYCGKAIW